MLLLLEFDGDSLHKRDASCAVHFIRLSLYIVLEGDTQIISFSLRNLVNADGNDPSEPRGVRVTAGTVSLTV